MEDEIEKPISTFPNPLKKINLASLSSNQIFLGVLGASVILGALSGYLLVGSGKLAPSNGTNSSSSKPPATASQDKKTFRDFAEGMIQKRPEPKNSNEYVEGTHLLVREGATPVALTSSVVDLSQYEGKKVKVLGETFKALKEGWLMDVGRVEVK